MKRTTAAAQKFDSEEAEAAWWQANKRNVESDLRKSMRSGTTVRLNDALAGSKRKSELQPVTIRLVSSDLSAARELAQDKGVGYQTYIRMLLHEALRKESARLSRQKV